MPCRALLFSHLLHLFLLGLVRASGAESSPHLPAPKDVRVYSYNFHSSLRWSPVEVDRGLVLYTVHFKTRGSFNQWNETNCTRISQTECSFPQSLTSPRWTFVLRVRAELGQVASDWVETDPFVGERNTTIGPPKVKNVVENSDSLLISVTPPFESEYYSFQYHVYYWENASSTTKKKTKTSSTLFKVGNLKELTLYCFRIQAEFETYLGHQLPGLQSAPQCHRTTVSEVTRAGYIVPIFVLVLILVIVGLFLLWQHRKTIKYWIYPPLEIPSHFEEYFMDFNMPVLEVLDNYAEDDPHDSLSILGEGSQTSGSSLDGQAYLHSVSSEVT